METAPFGQIDCSSAPVARARLGVLAPTPITLRPAGLRSWGRNVSGAAGVGQRTQRFAYSEARRASTLPLPTLPTRANRGVSRPAPAAPVPLRTYECIEHSTLFLDVLAPMPISLRLRRWKLPPSDRLAAPQRRSRRARLGVLAPTPITLRPATMGTALFGQIGCSSAPVAPGATRRACAHANSVASTYVLDYSSAPVACATRRACAHANHAAPCGLAFLGAQCRGRNVK